MENTCEEHEKFRKESFIKLLGYEGISNEKANEIYEKFGGDAKKRAYAIASLSLFRKLDMPAYLTAMDRLANDEIDWLDILLLNK